MRALVRSLLCVLLAERGVGRAPRTRRAAAMPAPTMTSGSVIAGVKSGRIGPTRKSAMDLFEGADC